MNPSYLFRTPLKTVLGVIISVLSCIDLCLCSGQFYSALKAKDIVESEFTTIAIPNVSVISEKTYGAGTGHFSNGLPTEMKKYYADLSVKRKDEIVSIENFYLTSAVSNIEPINYGALSEYITTNNRYGPSTGNLTEAILFIKIDEISAVSSEYNEMSRAGYLAMGFPEEQIANYGMECLIKGTVLEVIALNNEYPDPVGRKANITFRFSDLDSLKKYNLKPGLTCLVFGSDYNDDDHSLREYIAACSWGNITNLYQDISWKNIYNMSQDDVLKMKMDNPDAEEFWKYEYIYSPNIRIALKPSEYDMMNRISLTVAENILVLKGEVGRSTVILADGSEIDSEEFSKIYCLPSIDIVNGDVNEYINSEEGRIWREWMDVIDKENHSFPVISTSNIGSIARFASGDTILTKGRGFSEHDYNEKKNVCIISETVALKNGLNIGDSMTLQFYDHDGNYNYWWRMLDVQFPTSNPSADYYSPVQRFSSEEQTFEVIGFYRQKNQWSDGTYDFTPNTVFVPEGTLRGKLYTTDWGLFSSMVLKNGSIDIIENQLNEDGMDGTLIYYDGGYSNIKEAINEYFNVSPWIFFAGVIVWFILTITFAYIFVFQRKKDVIRMNCLGKCKYSVVKDLFLGGFVIVLPGILVGMIFSLVLFENVINIFNSTFSDLTLIPIISNNVVIIATICDLSISVLVLYIASVVVLKKSLI